MINISSNGIDFFLELYKAHPELFKEITKRGIKGLKIIPSKFKEFFNKIKEFANQRGELKNVLPILDEEETENYLGLIKQSQNEKFKDLQKYLTPWIGDSS